MTISYRPLVQFPSQMTTWELLLATTKVMTVNHFPGVQDPPTAVMLATQVEHVNTDCVHPRLGIKDLRNQDAAAGQSLPPDTLSLLADLSLV